MGADKEVELVRVATCTYVYGLSFFVNGWIRNECKVNLWLDQKLARRIPAGKACKYLLGAPCLCQVKAQCFALTKPQVWRCRSRLAKEFELVTGIILCGKFLSLSNAGCLLCNDKRNSICYWFGGQKDGMANTPSRGKIIKMWLKLSIPFLTDIFGVSYCILAKSKYTSNRK